MFDFMNITKSLSDESRVRIMLVLKDKSLCVQQIVSLLGLAPSTVSKHISILEQARLVKGIRQGKWVFYSLIDKETNFLIEDVLSFLLRGTSDSAQIKSDSSVIKEIEKEYCKIHGEIHTNKGEE